MAKVHFFYSTMNAGKSTALLQSNHNYQETGMHTILFIPKEDVSKNSGSIKSRIGLKAPAVVLDKNMNLFNFVKDKDAVQHFPSNGIGTLSGVIVEADITTGLAKKVSRLIVGGSLVN